jgi:hypothetical protein
MKVKILVTIALLFASLCMVAVQADSGSSSEGTAVVLPSLATNASAPPTSTPTLPVSWTELLVALGTGLAALREWLKDRNWQKKYKNVIVTKP